MGAFTRCAAACWPLTGSKGAYGGALGTEDDELDADESAAVVVRRRLVPLYRKQHIKGNQLRQGRVKQTDPHAQ